MRKFIKYSIICFILVLVPFVMVACTEKDNSIKEIMINTENVKVLFDITDDFTSEGLIVQGKTEDSDYQSLEGYTIDHSSFKKGEVGTYTIKISYEDIEDSYTVQIKDKGILTITKNSIFAKGQTFENNSPEITYTNSNGQSTIINDYQVISFDTVNVGSQTAVISAFGFDYNVGFSVVENDNFFETLVNNTLIQTQEEQIKFAEFYWWNESIQGVEPDEVHTIAQSNDYIYRYSAMYNRKGWATISGLAIMEDSNGTIITQQCNNQDEALEVITNFTVSSLNAYNSYMQFVYNAEILIQSEDIEYNINCVKTNTIINITVTIANYRYEVTFNTEVGIFEEAKVYVSDFMINHYIFYCDFNTSTYAPPSVA